MVYLTATKVQANTTHLLIETLELDCESKNKVTHKNTSLLTIPQPMQFWDKKEVVQLQYIG